MVATWEFADIKLSEPSSEASEQTLDNLLTCWKTTCNQFAFSKDVPADPAYDFICSIENNKLLQSSTPGSLKALAKFYITGVQTPTADTTLMAGTETKAMSLSPFQQLV
jgi:hypothetical protein